MDTSLPSKDDLTLDELKEQCQVTGEVVVDWIQEKRLPTCVKKGKLTVKCSELLKFLCQNKEYAVLSRLPYLDETEKDVFYYMEKTERTAKPQPTEEIHRKIESMYSEIREKCEECTIKLRSLEEQYGLPSPEIEPIQLTSLEELCKKHGTLNCKTISFLCGVDNKTISRWKDDGLEMHMKNGKLETSLVSLINFLELDEKKTKYLERIVSVNFQEIVESLEKRYTIVRKHLKAKKQKPNGLMQELYRDISAILKTLKINVIDSKEKTTNEISALEHISEIVKRATRVTPDDIGIGKTLIKKLNIITEDGIKDIERKREEYGYQIVNLVFKLWMDIEAKAKPSDADDIQSVYVKLIQERGLDPIGMNLSNTGLTPKFVFDELATAKPVPMRNIFMYYIPKDKISPALCFRIYILLQYVDNWQGDWLLQEMFERKEISIADAELYAVCWFLHHNIWSSEDISRENKVIGIGALMGIETDAVYKRLRMLKSLESDIASDSLKSFLEGIQNMLNPAYGNMFESSTNGENENLPDEEKGGIDYSERENYVEKSNFLVREDEENYVDNLFNLLKKNKITMEETKKYLKDELERIQNGTGRKGFIERLKYVIVHTQDETQKKEFKQWAQDGLKISMPTKPNRKEQTLASVQ